VGIQKSVLATDSFWAQSGRSYANGISWPITNEEKTIQFPTGKEIAKTLSAQARAGRSPMGICGILDME
jgi:hypothetical protein